MKIFNNLNRKQNLKKNLNSLENMINQKILDQKDLLKEQNKIIKDFLKKTELTEENEYDFYHEISNLFEKRCQMIQLIDNWVNSLYQIKKFKGEK